MTRQFHKRPECARQPPGQGCIVAKNHADRVTGANRIADLYFGNEADPRIDFVFDAHAATAGLGDGMSDFGGTNFRDEPGARRFYLKRFVCQRQNPGGIVTDVGLAALGRDVGAKCFERRSGFVDSFDSIARRLNCFFQFRQHNHARGQFD